MRSKVSLSNDLLSVDSSIVSGLPYTTVILLGRGSLFFLGHISYEPMMAVGRMGTRALWANLTKPL